MATTRIKDLSKTATTVNSDANLVLDGNTGGTQKITRDNFRQDTADAFVAAPGTYNLAPINSGTGKIDATYLPTSSDTPKGAWDANTNTPTLADGSGTAGDYYDVTVAGSSDLGSGSITFTVGDVVKYNGTTWFKIDSVTNILDGVSTIDGAKAAIEIPDVGTDPSEVPLNQHLGSLAYQSADSVSMGTVEITDKIDLAGAPTQQLEISGDAPTVRVTDTSVSVANGESIGKLEFYGNDGSSGGPNVRARIDTVAESAAGNYYGLAISTSASNASPVEHIRVASNGNTGIGTDSPDVTLDCSGSTDNSEYAHFSNSNQRHLKLSSYDVGGNTNAGHDINASSSVGALSLSTGGSEAVRIDSSQRVGIGTASPSTNSYAEADDLVIGDGTLTYHGLSIVTNSSGQGSLMFSDGSGVNAYRGIVRYNHVADSLELWQASAKRWEIGSTGNLTPATGLGIDFGSTTSGSGTVTGGVLSDYEEGTWTVTTASDATGAISAQDGYYTKVGNLVTVRATFTVSTTFTGNQVGGLPFLPQIAGVSGASSGTVALTSNNNASPVLAYASHLSANIKFLSGTNTGALHVLNTTNATYRLFMSYYA